MTVTTQHTLERKQPSVYQRPIQQVGNYVVYKKTLGAGSMGTVKLAECLSTKDHQLYAVKIVPKTNTVGPENSDPKNTPEQQEQRTIRELAIMRLFNHPHICKLRECIVQGDHYYMFLEYVEGGQLLDYIIHHGKLKETLARKFARQIASAVDYCHRNSIVHRDLKIENILLTNNKDIKIIDFGLSNLYSPVQLLNTFCGSLYFAAPELLRAKYYTGPEVDVWSFGVVLYVLACGRVPFDDTNLPALHQKIKEGHVDYPDHLTKECVDLLSKILVVDPLKRESLSFIIDHPWMNEGYDRPISNHIPNRQTLTTIDPHIVQGMQGFNFGSSQDIHKQLLHLISTPEYQHASHMLNRPGSRNTDGDPQNLPAVYDPLISIYFLVKERQELDEKHKFLTSEGYTVGRSASTSLSKHHYTTTASQLLSRRKTDHALPHRPLQEKQALNRSPSTLQKKQVTLLQRANSSDRKKVMKLSPSPNLGGRFIEEGLLDKVFAVSKNSRLQPRSLFHFGRRDLFKIPSSDMLQYMQRALGRLHIRYAPLETFLWKCNTFDWYGQGPVEFTLMIFQARWASGRLGVKLLEAEEERKIYTHLYHTILNELGNIISCQNTQQ